MVILYKVEGTTQQGAGLRDALCEEHNYQDNIDGEPNPESKKDFAIRMFDRLVKDIYVQWKMGQYEKGVGTIKSDAKAEIDSINVS